MQQLCIAMHLLLLCIGVGSRLLQHVQGGAPKLHVLVLHPPVGDVMLPWLLRADGSGSRGLRDLELLAQDLEQMVVLVLLRAEQANDVPVSSCSEA